MGRSSQSWYVSLDEAAEVLAARQSQGVREEVESWWRGQGVEIPEVLCGSSGLHAIMARHVPTFRYEDAVFVIMAERARLRPVWLGYVDDIFFGASPVKNSLLAPLFVNRIGRSGGRDVRRVKLARIALHEGAPLSTILCINGSSDILLPEFHRDLLVRRYPGALIGDVSGVNRELGGGASHYYPAFLSLALAHGVLFENYHGGESGNELNGFTARVFEPAFREVEARFGMKPLIVTLPWWPELALYPGDPLTSAISWRRHGFALKNFVFSSQDGSGSLALV